MHATHRGRVRWFTGVAAAAAVVALAGCSGTGGGGSSASPGAPEVGFSAAVLDNPFTANLVTSVVDNANDIGLNMGPALNADGDPAKQITDFNTLLQQGVKGIIFIPRDSDAIIPAVEAANKAGVPVVTVDTAANGGEIYMQVRADNVAMGRSACERLGPLIPADGTVFEVTGSPSTSVGADRSSGFHDCMEENFPGVTIVSKDGAWSADTSADVIQTVVNSQDFDGVYLASDVIYLPPLLTVMKNLGKAIPAGEPGHIPVVTIDGSAGGLQAIRDGFVDGVVSQPVDQYGIWGPQYLKDAIEGKTYKVGPTDHGSEIVEYEGNLADIIPSPMVTKDNVDDPALWGNFKN